MSNTPDPKHGFTRYMQSYYQEMKNRGLADDLAKARMYDMALQSCKDLLQKEEAIPDELLVLSTQFIHQLLNHRGASLTEKVKKSPHIVSPESEEIIKALQQIKKLHDETASFISTYKGDHLGKSKSKR